MYHMIHAQVQYEFCIFISMFLDWCLGFEPIWIFESHRKRNYSYEGFHLDRALYGWLHHDDNTGIKPRWNGTERQTRPRSMQSKSSGLAQCFMAVSFWYILKRPQTWYFKFYSQHSIISDEHPALHFRLPQKKMNRARLSLLFQSPGETNR